MKTHKNAIFDLCGVLLSWDSKALIRALKEEDNTFPDNMDDIIDMPTWLQYDRGLFTRPEVVSSLSHIFDRRHLERFFDGIMEQFRPLESGMSLLRKKQKEGTRCFLLSNLGLEVKDFCLKTFPFLHTLNGCVFSCDIRLIKPDIAIYEYILNQYKLVPEETAFYDDLNINVMSARTMGIDAVLHIPEPAMEAEELLAK
ncbi:MAG: hypothetical protein A2Y14_05715 [Verrucomicrobia bacterium GWF2_51_19]|nr:MAG: hypothetical protein A2Y14_05715 [Verrucomicrobia bacterium GWF2_51_19]